MNFHKGIQILVEEGSRSLGLSTSEKEGVHEGKMKAYLEMHEKNSNPRNIGARKAKGQDG